MQRSSITRLVPLALALATFAHAAAATDPPPQVPGLRFTENLGQAGDAAKFTTRVGPAQVLFEPGAMVVHVQETRPMEGHGAQLAGAPPRAAIVPLPGADVRFAFDGAAPAQLSGRGLLPGFENVYAGLDPATWHAGLHAFGALDYAGLWSGITLAVHERDGALHYDIVVEPGADLAAFGLRVEGAEGVDVDSTGALVVRTACGVLRQTIPAAWEEDGDARVPVAARFVLDAEGRARLAVAGRDASRRLVVDPGLDFSALVVAGCGIVNCPNVQFYSLVVQQATGLQFLAGYWGDDAYIQAWDVVNGGFVWGTFIIGANIDQAIDLCFSAGGDLYVSGITNSFNLPTTPGVFQFFPQGGGGDAFVARLNAAGALVALTYVGGAAGSEGNNTTIDIGPNGLITVAGSTDSFNFPIAPIGLTYDFTWNGGDDAWVMQLNPALTGFVRSTFFGGGLDETLGFGGVVVGPDNSVYLGGWTDSPNLPVVAAFDPLFGGGLSDAFLARLTPNLGALVFSTYRGGPFQDAFNGIALDDVGNVWGAGYSDSPGFPGIGPAGVLDPTYNGNGDAFITKHSPTGAFLWGTYRGGNGQDSAMRIAVDRFGRAHWSGTTNSGLAPNFLLYPITPIDGFGPALGGYSGYVDMAGPDGTIESYSTYVDMTPADDSFSGIALDSRGNVYLGGGGLNFPLIGFQGLVARVTPPWFDEGFALPGTTTPQLMGDGTLVGGFPTELRLSNCVPGAVATLVIGAGPLFVAFRGGILVPMPNLLVTPLVIPAGGELVLPAAWPFGVPPGTKFFMQAWMPDAAGPAGFAASNGISTDTP